MQNPLQGVQTPSTMSPPVEPILNWPFGSQNYTISSFACPVPA